MGMRGFLATNGLKQVDVARYLGVTEAAVSNVVKGKSKLSSSNLIKLRRNPHNWDTSMLAVTASGVAKGAESIPEVQFVTSAQRKQVLGLINMLKEDPGYTKRLLEEVDELKKSIAELREENALLREENAVLKFQLKDSK